MTSPYFEQTTIHVDQIPVEIFRPKESAQTYKTILYYHGWTSQVENYYFLGQALATQGYQVIMPELFQHGQRQEDPEFFDKPMHMIQVLLTSMKEYSQIKESKLADLTINPQHFYIAGHSMGSMLSAMLFLENPELKAGFLYSGLLDFVAALEDLKLEYDLDLPAQILAEIASISPQEHLGAIADRQLYIFHGLQDEVVSPKYMQELEEKLQADQEQIHFYFYENAGHDLTYKMIRDSLRILESKLG